MDGPPRAQGGRFFCRGFTLIFFASSFLLPDYLPSQVLPPMCGFRTQRGASALA